MNKFNGKLPLLLLLLVVGALVFYSPTIRTFFIAFTTTVQDIYLDTKKSIQEGVERHMSQAETIDALRRKEKNLQKRLIACQSNAQNFIAMKAALGVKPDCNMTILPVRSKGYALLGNFQQVWLEDFPDYNPLKNYGVIRDGFAVGIVVEKRQRPLMILAGDKECNFAVYIGENRAPGIAMGEDAQHMTVKYIPEWMKLARGDRVFTSGLDHIFPMGIPVGYVLSVEKMQGFKNAKIELYGDTLHPDFVWVVGR